MSKARITATVSGTELFLTASRTGLEELASLVESGGTRRLDLPVADDRHAALAAFREIEVRATAERVRVEPLHDELVITGSPEARRQLAVSLRFLARQDDRIEGGIPGHLHIDYYEGHPWIDPSTRYEVVVERTE